MPESTPVNPAESGLDVGTQFVRSRRALLARADFGLLYVDYYLHLAEQQMRPAPEHDALFKRALAVFVLHCASRPANELTAWTLHFQEPFLNIFLNGDNETGAVTGRVFSDNVKELPENIFYADVVRGTEPSRRSTVPFQGGDLLAAVEAFYAKSEQRLARCFQLGEEEFALVSEHPDCDLAWLRNLTAAGARDLEKIETVVPLTHRVYRWHCGCNQKRMLQVLAPAFRSDAGRLFAGEEKIEIRCPRCGARHMITREAMEAYVAQQPNSPPPPSA